jgi:hypothetical protein
MSFPNKIVNNNKQSSFDTNRAKNDSFQFHENNLNENYLFFEEESPFEEEEEYSIEGSDYEEDSFADEIETKMRNKITDKIMQTMVLKFGW